MTYPQRYLRFVYSPTPSPPMPPVVVAGWCCLRFGCVAVPPSPFPHHLPPPCCVDVVVGVGDGWTTRAGCPGDWLVRCDLLVCGRWTVVQTPCDVDFGGRTPPPPFWLVVRLSRDVGCVYCDVARVVGGWTLRCCWLVGDLDVGGYSFILVVGGLLLDDGRCPFALHLQLPMPIPHCPTPPLLYPPFFPLYITPSFPTHLVLLLNIVLCHCVGWVD